MRKLLLTGALALMGVVVPSASVALAGGASAAPIAAPAASAASAASPVLYHVPIIGKHLLGLSLGLGGLRHTTNVQSSNWAGYADTGSTFQTLSSSWVQPVVNCSSTNAGGLLGLFGSKAAYSAFWVGLDGYTSSSVEQTGTDSDCTSSGAPSYYAWYEMYPAGSVDLSTTTYPVAAGNSMTGMVMSNAAGTSFNLSIKNNTRGWTFSITLPGSGLARSSAEFVAEAPSQCNVLFCSQLALANFGTVNFTGASVADTTGHVGNIGSYTNVDMQMASNGTVKATPGPLAGGTGFSVTFQHS
jgi:hypothetical protein